MEQNFSIKYPKTKRGDTIDKHNLQDPYRWLEDPDAKETQEWVEEQNKVSRQYLEKFSHKEKLTQKLTDIYNYEKFGAPSKAGDNYYFSKNDGLQNQYVIYTQKTLEDQPKVFMDPNTLSEDGTTALSSSSFSEDGKFWAYGLTRGGSDWVTGYVKDVNSKQDLQDKLEFVKFSGFSWTHDNKGFFYNRYPKPESITSTESGKAGTETDSNLNQKVYYHLVGQEQSQDILIFENPSDPKKTYSTKVSHDGKYLILYTSDGCANQNKLYIASLENFNQENQYKIDFIKLIDNFDAMFGYITNDDNIFYLETNCDNAHKNKIISIDLSNTDKQNWKTIIAESEFVIQETYVINSDQLLVLYNQDAHDVMKLFKLQTGEFIRDIDTPTVGSVGVSKVKRNDTDFFYLFTSFLYPNSIYRYDFKTGESKLFKAPKIQGFDPEEFETKQVFYNNTKDNTKIPMFIVSAKTEDNSPKPFYLYGYGGFNISLTPFFSPFRIILMKNLGINIAIANIRGGGEYGEDWHQQGTKERKQNVFDDFCSAAEYLIEHKYSTNQLISIAGGSNGGLLVAACANQRPDLFKAGICQVGVLDMLRFHLFTIGHAWTTDYGCADNEEDFKYLIKYSPIHNVNKHEKGYPAMLITTGSHDDRVVPLHSYKYISALQHELGDKSYQKEPLLIRIETKAGHGAGRPTTKIIEEVADIYSFLASVMQLEWKE